MPEILIAVIFDLCHEMCRSHAMATPKHQCQHNSIREQEKNCTSHIRQGWQMDFQKRCFFLYFCLWLSLALAWEIYGEFLGLFFWHACRADKWYDIILICIWLLIYNFKHKTINERWRNNHNLRFRRMSFAGEVKTLNRKNTTHSLTRFG